MATIRKRIGKRGNTSWQIDFYDPKGKRVMKCFKLRKDAEAYLGKALSAKKEERYYDVFDIKKENQTTFNDLADLYIKTFGDTKRYKSNECYMINFFKQELGEKKLSQITYLELETIRNLRKDTLTKWGKPKATATVNDEINVLAKMLNKAVEWGMLEVSPFAKGRKLIMKLNNQRDRFLSLEEIERLINCCNAEIRPIVEMALHTGMRRGELLNLTWEQIRGGFIYLKKTKTDKPRQIPVNARVEEIFRELKIKNAWKSPYVFLKVNGERMGKFRYAFEGACKHAGIENFTFHDLRHTFASHLAMKGATQRELQDLLGHSTATMTKRYAHLSEAHLKTTINLLNDLPTGKKLENVLPFSAEKAHG
jgi:integrase